MGSDRRRRKAGDEHDRAVDRYVSAALRLEEPEWSRPVSGGAWSPAQITQHVILCYDVAFSDLSGGPGAGPRVGPILSTILRWFLLPHVLFHRNLPGSRAPVETEPLEHPGPPDSAVQRLREGATAFENLALERDVPFGRRLRHPYFGPLSPHQALRLMSLHTEHHARQLEAVRSSSGRP